MISLVLPGLPPTTNHAYANLAGHGGRRLTDEAKSYKIQTSTRLVSLHRREMMFFQKNKPYLFFVRFFFREIVNVGYPKKAENRYKKVDGSNRLKLLEDAIATAAGIDDSQGLVGIWEKVQGLPERTGLWAWDLEAEKSPFHDALRTL